MADASTSHRKVKERDGEPDLYEKMIALRRKQHAVPVKPRERPEKPSTRSSPPLPPVHLSPPRRANPPPPQVLVSRTDSMEALEDSHRRKKPSTFSPRAHHASPQSAKAQGKLFNPDVDPIPTMRRTAEPEILSDNGSSSYAHRNGLPSQDRGAHHGRLFDHKRDDPVRFHVLARPNPANGNRPAPTPKSSGEYVSASSTSSYAHSITSSNFTLNSTTDGSSASSAVFDQQNREHAGSGAFAAQLKKLYRLITNLEAKLLKDEGKDAGDDVRISLKRPNSGGEAAEVEREKWKTFVADHKTLAELMHNLLRLTLAPHVPASLRNIPTKYNIIIRLWTHAFNKPLETIRRASFQSPVALEHLQEFMYFAYTFYTMLLEEPTLASFKSGWLEALGDLSRYRMAIAAMTAPQALVAAGDDFTPVNETALAAQTQPESSVARIDDSLGPSVGVAAARALELEPEKERWRCIARQWYAAGLTDTPGTGKLHHHLGLLSRDADDEELRAVYHFAKSMTTLHPFSTSRESVLPVWSTQAQTRRSAPDAHVSDLFLLLHGMMFTNIQLDDFKPTLARFMERLQFEEPEERDWIMMAIVNIAAVLEYGRPTGVLRSTGGIGNIAGATGRDTSTAAQAAAASAKVNMMVKKLDEMEVDDMQSVKAHSGEQDLEQELEAGLDGKTHGIIDVSPVLVQAPVTAIEDIEYPLAFKYALQLTFDMLAYTLRSPKRTANPFSRETLNPYITIMLTFLVTILKHPAAQKAIERSVPWADLASFFGTIPRGVLGQAEGGIRLTSACPPLPEDWCMRGMEWVGRRVYERGFWKSGEEQQAEIDVLNKTEGGDHITDGIIEDESEDSNGAMSRSDYSETKWRWVRIVRAAAGLAKFIPGFNWEMGTKSWEVSGELLQKVARWQEEDRLAREEEERRRSRRPWVDEDMDVDEDNNPFMDPYSEESEDDEQSEEIKMLRARRNELVRLMNSGKNARLNVSKARAHSKHPRDTPKSSTLRVVPGYTILVVDTNIFLSSLSIFSALVESLLWTIVVPLAVITELDGIATNTSQLGESAKSAITYITSHLRSHAVSLKVQTSKGNYLSTLSVRSEQVEFSSDSWERNMDDLILRAAIWQDDHWVDRSSILGTQSQNASVKAAKVVLLSFDRNLRLKARARQLDAADEKDMAAILKAGS